MIVVTGALEARQGDPVSGEVLGLVDGLGTKSCDEGTWPAGR